VSVAGIRRLIAEGRASPDECVVCVVTGSGFKDFDRIAERVKITEQVVTGYDELLAAAHAVQQEVGA
jgi:threonine synthase